MAYFQRRNGKVTAYYYVKGEGPKQIPRDVTAAFDDLSDVEVLQRLAAWEADHGVKRIRSRKRTLLSTDDLARLFALHLATHKLANDPSIGTVAEYQYHFDSFIRPFFVEKHACSDVTKWWQWTAEFPIYVSTELKKQPTTVRKVCHTLRRFGEFLVEQRKLDRPWLVRAPRARGKRTTPLARRLAPDEVIELAKALHRDGHTIWALDHLLSYFGSLRPEETYALDKEDFLTGDEARAKAKTWSRFQKYGLGSGLSVRVYKTHIGKEPQKLTKTHYAAGVVNIWSPEAAKLIAGMLKTCEPGRLFPGTRNQINYRYRKLVKPRLELDAQDRRRASANYLGKTVGVDPILLQDHLRHSEMETTMLYTRDPLDREEETGGQNFDDVG